MFSLLHTKTEIHSRIDTAGIADPMFRRAHTQYIALTIFFAFCQVIGTMCALPTVSVAEEVALLVEDTMVCPMDGTIMCPPSMTSSPERQVKNGKVADIYHAVIGTTLRTVLPTLSVETLWSRSREFPLVLPRIVALPVLRI